MEVHADRDYHIARGVAGSPQVVVIMRTDGPGEAIGRSEIIDGAGFAVVAGENGAVSAIFEGQTSIYRGNDFRLVARVEYQRQEVYIRAVLTHAEYSKEDWKRDTWFQRR